MRKFIFYFLILLFVVIMGMKFVVRMVIDHYRLSDNDTATFIIHIAGKFLLLIGLYLAFRKETFFDLRKALNNNVGVLILVGVLLFLSLRFSLPYVGTRYSWVNLTAYYTQCLSTGFMEEVLCRWLIFGLVVVVYPQRKALGQIVTASAFFALLHIGNFITGDHDVFSVLNQMLFAFLMGLFLQGLFIRYRNIILVTVLHGLANFHGMYNAKFKPEDKFMTEGDSMTDLFQTQIFFGIVCLVVLLVLRLTMKKEDVKRLYAL